MEFIRVIPFNDLNNPPFHNLSNNPFMYMVLDTNSKSTPKGRLYDKNFKVITSNSGFNITNGSDKYLLVNQNHFFEITFSYIAYNAEKEEYFIVEVEKKKFEDDIKNESISFKEDTINADVKIPEHYTKISEPSTSSHSFHQVSTSFDTSSKHSDVIISQPKKDYNCSALVTCAYNPSDYKNKQNLDFDDSPLKID